MAEKYIVRLTEEERQHLEDITRKGKTQAYRIRHANILLKANSDDDWSSDQIAKAFDCNQGTVCSIRRRFVTEGLEAALERKPQKNPSRQPTFDGRTEAQLIALSLSAPPEGQSGWSLRLLAEKLVELEIVDEVSHETVRTTLKKNEIKPHLKKQWCIPPEHNGDFVACMEDVIDVYHLPYRASHPVVCMDEQPIQFLKETRKPIPPAQGQPARVDYEYERNGTGSVFLFTEALQQWRHVSIRDRRTAVDWAQEIKELLDVRYAQAEKVLLVMDNLNTHSIGSLYEAFEPIEARRLAQRLEIHHTPKHGSWLNIAECELSAFTRQCLPKRVPNKDAPQIEIRAWVDWRNRSQKEVDWQFTTKNARIKLKRLYPQFQP